MLWFRCQLKHRFYQGRESFTQPVDYNGCYRNPGMQKDFIAALAQKLCEAQVELESCKQLLHQTATRIDGVGKLMGFASHVITSSAEQTDAALDPINSISSRSRK